MADNTLWPIIDTVPYYVRTWARTSVVASVGSRRQDRQDMSNELNPFPLVQAHAVPVSDAIATPA